MKITVPALCVSALSGPGESEHIGKVNQAIDHLPLREGGALVHAETRDAAC